VVADWGLGRRPRGQTTARRTRVGTPFGTEGFAAPELAVDAHAAGPQADIYSIGQIIGWALTGNWPQANIPLLPAAGPWRAIVKAATSHQPEQRISNVDELLELIAAELDSPEALADRGRRLLAAARAGDLEAPQAMFRLVALAGIADKELVEQLLGLGHDQIGSAIDAAPAVTRDVVRVLRGEWHALGWLLVAAEHAEQRQLWDLLDDIVEAILAACAHIGSDDPRVTEAAEWIGSRTGQAASSVTAALRRVPASARIVAALNAVSGMDHRIRRALSRAPATDPATHRKAAARRPFWRRRRLTLAASGALAVLTTSVVAVSLYANQQAPDAGNRTDNPLAGLPRAPGELALPTMKEFVRPWNNYPNWRECRSGEGETAVTGSFPARPRTAVTPSKSIHCDNGGNLVAMFAEFPTEQQFEEVSGRYLSAAPPASPATSEQPGQAEPHLFAWSATQRAVVWTDRKYGLVGLLVTDSPQTDLVELWNRYVRGT
jgi:hypothetical protein